MKKLLSVLISGLATALFIAYPAGFATAAAFGSAIGILTFAYGDRSRRGKPLFVAKRAERLPLAA
jgi:hypothetical protein